MRVPAEGPPQVLVAVSAALVLLAPGALAGRRREGEAI
jgi:hypothetical protein